MRFALGNISLSNVSGGTLNNGNVPWVRSKRTRVTASNAGVVTLTSGSFITVVSNNLGTVVAGDLIVAQFSVTFTVGTTSPSYAIAPHQSAGTATVQYLGTSTEPVVGDSAPAAGGGCQESGPWYIDVTVGGTLTLDLRINQVGTSSGTVAAGAGRWDCIVYAGS